MMDEIIISDWTFLARCSHRTFCFWVLGHCDVAITVRVVLRGVRLLALEGGGEPMTCVRAWRREL
jgi:hypothetical protein